MAVGYGTSSKPIGLSKSRIGRAEEAKEEQSALVDILLLLGEIASLAIPGYGELLSFGFASAQAGKTVAEQVESGHPSPWAIGLSIGGALVSGGAAVKGIAGRLGQKATLLKDLDRPSQMAAKYEAMFGSRTGGITGRIGESDVIDYLSSIQSRNDVVRNLADQFMGPFSDMERALARAKRNPGWFDDTGSYLFGGKRYSGFEEIYGNWDTISEEIRKMTIQRFNTLSSTTSAAEAPGDLANERAKINDEIKKILGKRDYQLWLELLAELSQSSRLGMSMTIRRFFKGLSATKQAKLIRASRRLLNTDRAFILLSTAANVPSWWKYLTSSRFYNREVQWIQNMNGSDFGRWVAEQSAQIAKKKAMQIGSKEKIGAKAWKELNAEQRKMYGDYKKFKAMAEKTIGGYSKGTYKSGKLKVWYQRMLTKATELGKTALEREQKIEKLFAEAGGVVIPSRYLLGYKIISTKGAGNLRRHYVQMSFRKWATRSASGKNKSGKAPIMIYATSKDLRRLSTEGSTYWFQVGAKKGWFMSRGGRTVNVGSDMSAEISTVLTFLPVQAIRSFGSILSNFKAFGELVKSSTSASNFIQLWGGEFNKALISTSINRAGRIGANQFIGRWAGHTAGRFVGKFSQQIITGSINSARLSMNSKTNLSWAHYMRQQAFGKNGFLSMRLQSEMKRGVLKKTGRRVSGQTGRRKLQITASARGWASW